MKSAFARTVAALTLASLPVSAMAAEAEKPCLEAAEAQALLVFILPGTFTQVSDQCRDALPPTSTLTRVGRTLATRYQPEAEAAWPLARAAFGKMSDPAMLKLLGDDTLKKLVSAGVASGITKAIKPKDCGTVDQFVAALEPLPARNMAMLVGALMEAGSKMDANGNRNSPFKICPKPELTVPLPVPKPIAPPKGGQ